VKRFASLLAAASTLACAAGLTLIGGPASAAPGGSAAQALPTLNLALTGTKGISVSGSEVSGAVNVVSTFSGKGGPGFAALVRIDPGVTYGQGFQAIQAHGGDLNAITPYGSLSYSAPAPSSVQTVLTPGNYIALNVTGMGQPGIQLFTVTASSSPVALPAAKSTEAAIDFGFTGPSVLRDGTIVRAENQGYLVHMITMIGVRNAASGQAVMALLRAGKDNAARKLATGHVSLLGPASPGAMQQEVLNAKPGYYVEACFMDTQDHRGHTRLGMLRLVRVVK
jgi:hypothetical protein